MESPKVVEIPSKEGREKVLNDTLSNIEKHFGKGAVMRLGEAQARLHVEVIPTGCLSLDLATGIGGMPRGRIVEVFGPESSGKTTVALHVIAEAQKAGGTAVLIDAEHALDPVYARNLGVNTDELLVSQPDYGEQALDIAEALVRSAAVDVIVIDSVAALVPRAELDGQMGDAHVGLQARLMSQAMRKLTGTISKSRTVVIFINQLRERVGGYGNPEVTTGGMALKFYASMRLDVRKTDVIKEGNNIVGSKVKVKVVKNKLAPPFRQAEFDLVYGQGISREGSILDLGTQMEIIQKSGSWYSFGEERLGQGRENAVNFLKEHPEIAMEIDRRIREAVAAGKPVPLNLNKQEAIE